MNGATAQLGLFGSQDGPPHQPKTPHVDTLTAARLEVRRNRANGGTRCPCCDQWVQQYRETITATMATVIRLMAGSHALGKEWVDVNLLIDDYNRDNPLFAKKVGGRWAKLRYWGLIEALDGRVTNGTWRLTASGISFAAGSPVPKHLIVFDGIPRGPWGDKTITLAEASRTKFSLNDVSTPLDVEAT